MFGVSSTYHSHPIQVIFSIASGATSVDPKERATKPPNSRRHWHLVVLELVMTKVHGIKSGYNVLHHVAPNGKPNIADKGWWLEENPFHFLDGIRIDSVLVSAWGCSFHSKQQEL